ncbi:hypothetical protein HWV62_42010 [Athelia sp. TMB]|nr:hypothetical protein HWV62_42010 [Athelia sp. TMB]
MSTAKCTCTKAPPPSDRRAYARHLNRYHAIPVPVRMDSGEFEVVEVRNDGGYNCFCGHYLKTREACNQHVWAHLNGREDPVFRSLKSSGQNTPASSQLSAAAEHPSAAPLDASSPEAQPILEAASGKPQTHILIRWADLRPAVIPPASSEDVRPTVEAALSTGEQQESDEESDAGRTPPRRSFAHVLEATNSMLATKHAEKSPTAAPLATPTAPIATPTALTSSLGSSGAELETPQPAKPLSIKRPVLVPGIDYIVSHPALDAVSVNMHTDLHLLRCLVCQHYLTSSNIKGHMTTHGLSIRRDALEVANNFCFEHDIFSLQKDVILPHPMGPPVQGLTTVMGYVCSLAECPYAVVDPATMAKHEQTHHMHPTLLLPADRKQVEVQTLFKNPARYFSVNVHAATCEDPDLADVLVRDFIPAASKPPPILTATDDRGRSPLEKHLQHDDLLLEVRKSRPDLLHLDALKQTPKTGEERDRYLRLLRVMEEWHKLIIRLLEGHPAKFDLERTIIAGTNAIAISRAERWTPISDFNETYIAHYAEFFRCILRQLRGHPFPVHIPLVPAQVAAFKRLDALLEDDTASSDVLIAGVQAASWELTRVAANGRWKNAYQVYFAFLSLRIDGTYAPASCLAPHLAKFTYMLRITCLYGGLQLPVNEAVPYILGLHDNVLSLHCAGMSYKWVRDTQSFVSSVAMKELRPPSCWVSSDSRTFVVGTGKLHIDTLRAAVQEVPAAIWAAYDKILGGKRFVNIATEDIVDDLSNTSRGYSFASHEPFHSRRHDCFLYVVQMYKLCTIDSQNRLSWNLPAIDRVLDACAKLWRLVAYGLSYTTQISPRLRQFMELTFINADRLRSFIFQSGDGLVMGGFHKMSAISDEDRYIPGFQPRPYSDILKELLGGGFREMEALLVHVRHGAQAAQTHRTYLFSEHGKRLATEQYYKVFEAFNKRFLDVGWGVRDLRHAMIAIAKEHIAPNDTFTLVQGLLSDSSDHSVAIENANYAIPYGDVTRLTNLAMWEANWLWKQWMATLGMSGKPLLPLKERAAVNEEQLGERVQRVVEATVKSSLPTILASVLEGLLKEALPGIVHQALRIGAEDNVASPSPASTPIDLPSSPSALPPSALPSSSGDDSDDDLPYASSAPPNEDRPWQLSPSPTPPFRASVLPSLREALLAPKPRLNQSPPRVSSSVGEKRSSSPEPPTPSKRARLAAEMGAPVGTGNAFALQPMDEGEDDIEDSIEETADAALIPSQLKPAPPPSLRSQSGALIPASFAHTPPSTSSNWPEFQLDDILDFEDPAWDAYKAVVDEAMRTLGYAGPKSHKQLQAICLVLEYHLNMFLVLPTGAGKTLIMQAMASIPVDQILEGRSVGGNVIAVVPFVALLEQQVAQSRAKGVLAFNWQERKSLGPVPDNTRLLYIQPESFISSEFQTFLIQWDSRGLPPFKRVFIDEIQDGCEGVPGRIKNTWKPLFQMLRGHHAQIILTTATLPPYLMPQYRELLDRDDFNVIREGCDRPNVAFHYIPGYDTSQFEARPRENYHHQDVVLQLIRLLTAIIDRSLTPNDRIMVFFPHVKTVRSFAEDNGFLWHDSSRTKLALQDTLSRWQGGTCRTLITSMAMAQGIDHPDIRYLIAADVFYGLGAVTQILGRGGRDELPSDFFFIGPHGADQQPPPRTGNPALDAQHQLNAESECQRRFAMTTMDGPVVAAYSCLDEIEGERGVVHPCGTCQPDGIHHVGLLAVRAASREYLRRLQASSPLTASHKPTSTVLPSVNARRVSSTSLGDKQPSRSILPANASVTTKPVFSRPPANSQNYFSSQSQPLSTAELRALDAAEQSAITPKVMFHSSTSTSFAHPLSFQQPKVMQPLSALTAKVLPALLQLQARNPARPRPQSPFMQPMPSLGSQRSSHRSEDLPESRRSANTPSSSQSSAPSSSSSAPSSSTPSMLSSLPGSRPMEDRSQAYKDSRDRRQAISSQLNVYLPALRNACLIHFGYWDELADCAAYFCDKQNPVADWDAYEKFRRSFQFAKYSYCFNCGTPNDTKKHNYFQPDAHRNIPTSDCVWKHLVFKTLFVIWHRTDSLRQEMFEAHGIDPRCTLDEFAEWATKDLEANRSGGYYNGLEFFMSFCSWQTTEGQAFDGMGLVEWA